MITQRLRFGLLLSLEAMSCPISATAAEAPWSWTKAGTAEADLYMLPARIQQMLQHDYVGEVRAWDCESGRHVRIRLVSGGNRAGSTTAKVEVITTTKASRTVVALLYRKDPRRGWVSSGCDPSRR